MPTSKQIRKATDESRAVFDAAVALVEAVNRVADDRGRKTTAAWVIGYLHRHLGHPVVTVDGESIPRIRDAFMLAERCLSADRLAGTYQPQIVLTAVEGVLRLLDALPDRLAGSVPPDGRRLATDGLGTGEE